MALNKGDLDRFDDSGGGMYDRSMGDSVGVTEPGNRPGGGCRWNWDDDDDMFLWTSRIAVLMTDSRWVANSGFRRGN